MPKYDYRCSVGHLYEKREGFDAPAVQVCDVCGVEARRVLTPPAIVFKGSGWYVTDSRKSSTASSAPTDTATTTDTVSTDTPGETKVEPKTEAKTESKASEAASSPTAAAD